MSATRHPEKRKKIDESDSDHAESTEVISYYIDRYEHADFFTLLAHVEPNNNNDDDSSDLDAAGLLDIASQPDEETIAAVKARRRAERPERPRRRKLASAEDKLDALSGNIDHGFDATVLIGEVPVVVSEAMRQNRRPGMEDRCDAAKLAGLQYLHHDDFYNIACKTTRKLQTLCVDADIDNAGSTYINVVLELSTQNIITTQLGDCEAWLHWIDKSGVHHLEALHGMVHHPHEADEFKRLQAAERNAVCMSPHRPNMFRLANGIAVSRALGDRASEPFGLIHQPTVSIRNYKEIAARAKEMRIIVGSDGVFGLRQFSTADALISFLSAPENQLRQTLLTNKIIEETMGKEDNASVMMVEIPLSAKLPACAYACETAVSLTVCDGHGTHRVAEKVTQMHAGIQQAVINKYLAASKPHVRQLPLSPTTPLDVMQPPPAPRVIISSDTTTMFGGGAARQEKAAAVSEILRRR